MMWNNVSKLYQFFLVKLRMWCNMVTLEEKIMVHKR